MARDRSDEKYFNFPIQLLQGFLVDSKECLSDIAAYAVYRHSLDLEFGTKMEAFNSSSNYFNISFGNKKKSYDNGRELYDSVPDNSPKVGVSLSVYWDYHKNDKSEFEKVCLLGYLAIKSILGKKKPYCKINNKYWLSRMDGNSHTVAEFYELSDEVKKYANEYQTKKIKTELRDNWGLVTYSRYTRGFYVSFKLNLEQLVFEAEKRRKSTKQKQYRDEVEQARKKALEMLKNHSPP